MNPDPIPNTKNQTDLPALHLLILLWRWLPLLLWAATIFAFSAQPNPYGALPASWPENWYDFLGSALHVLEYVLLVFLLARALVWRSRPGETALLAVILLGMLYALSDEIHQVFVPGRTFQALDLVLDWTGALIGVWVYLRFSRRKNRV